MHEFVVNVLKTVVISTESKVALLVEPNSRRVIVLDENPLPNIELLAVDQQRILDVLLDDKLAIFAHAVVGDIIQIVHAFDASAS